MIRPNRMAMGAIGGMAVALMLAGCGAQGTPAAQPSNAAADGVAPPVDVPLPGTGVDAPPVGQEPAGGGNAAPTDSSVTLIAKDLPKMGRVVTDAEGWTLYRFDKDSPKPSKSTCVDACEEKWPVIASEGVPVLQGIDPSLVGTVIRADGKQQVTLGGWPLYRFKADLQAGKWKGQGVGNTWWVVSPDGTRNLTCVPKGAKPPTGDEEADTTDDSGKGADAPDTGDSGGYDY